MALPLEYDQLGGHSNARQFFRKSYGLINGYELVLGAVIQEKGWRIFGYVVDRRRPLVDIGYFRKGTSEKWNDDFRLKVLGPVPHREIGWPKRVTTA